MKSIIKTLISSTTFLTLFFLLSNTAYALGEYTPLAPLPGTTVTTAGGVVQTNLETYIPGVFRLSIAIAAIMAFVAITFGGILYATSDAISGKSQGKELITNAIWGLVLVLGAWMLLYTINPKILRFDLDVQGVAATNATANPVSTARVMTAAEISADQAVRSQLVGVTVNNGPCLLGQTTGCTNVNGLPPATITALNSIKAGCNCDVVITGGTEDGHATHGVNEPIVDLRPTPSLNTYLGVSSPRDGQTVEKTAPNGTRVFYTYETAGGNPNGTSTGAHWHVVFN